MEFDRHNLPNCISKFVTKKCAKKYIYNIESANTKDKKVKKSKKISNENTYIRYDTYRPSINEDSIININFQNPISQKSYNNTLKKPKNLYQQKLENRALKARLRLDKQFEFKDKIANDYCKKLEQIETNNKVYYQEKELSNYNFTSTNLKVNKNLDISNLKGQFLSKNECVNCEPRNFNIINNRLIHSNTKIFDKMVILNENKNIYFQKTCELSNEKSMRSDCDQIDAKHSNGTEISDENITQLSDEVINRLGRNVSNLSDKDLNQSEENVSKSSDYEKRNTAVDFNSAVETQFADMKKIKFKDLLNESENECDLKFSGIRNSLKNDFGKQINLNTPSEEKCTITDTYDKQATNLCRRKKRKQKRKFHGSKNFINKSEIKTDKLAEENKMQFIRCIQGANEEFIHDTILKAAALRRNFIVNNLLNNENNETLLNVNIDHLALESFLSALDLGRTGTSISHGVVQGTSINVEKIHQKKQEVEHKKKQLEKERDEISTILREKEGELQWKSSITSSERIKLSELIKSLQSKVRELDKKIDLQNVLRDELSIEEQALKKFRPQRSNTFTELSTFSSNAVWKRPNASNQQVQTSPESCPSIPSEINYLDRKFQTSTTSSGNMYGHYKPITSQVTRQALLQGSYMAPTSSYNIDLHRASLDPASRYPYSYTATPPQYSTTTLPDIYNQPMTMPPDDSSTADNSSQWNRVVGGNGCVILSRSQSSASSGVQTDVHSTQATSTTISNENSTCSDDTGCQIASHSSVHQQQQPPSQLAQEIDRIMAKINQDNKILAELDRSRGITGYHTNTAQNPNESNLLGTIGIAAQNTILSAAQPNFMKPLAPVTTSFSTTFQQLSSTAGGGMQFNLVSGGTRMPIIPTHKCEFPTTVPSNQQPYSMQSTDQFPMSSQMNMNFDIDSAYSTFMSGSNLIRNGNIPGSSFINSRNIGKSTDSNLDRIHDMVEIPGKGLCYVYIAKYPYDPFSRSTGSCPEAELAVNAGDYLLVWGGSDDEGYVDAELMDGRRGLVPITYIQRLSGEELMDFNQRVLAGMKESDDCRSTAIPQDIGSIPPGSHRIKSILQNTAKQEHTKKYGQDYTLSDMMEDEQEDDVGEPVPAPKQLTLERQLNKSIVIRWNPPENSHAHCIDSYHVYVDKMLKATVKATERTKALLEGVDSNKPHRISVRSVTHNRRTSRDGSCTTLIGKNVPVYPTNIRASNVTPTSAVISWLPSNSNYPHTVCVNNVEVRTVKPGLYRHTITGLVPNTVYRVTIRAKNIRAPQYNDKTVMSDKFASHIEFHTLPKGMPNPPAEIQVENGPQDGTLLVTWTPVAANSSNSALVTGYAVYADGKKITEVNSPTGDHALIDISRILSLNPKQVTVRTKSRENHSADSIPVPIPHLSMSRNRQHTSKMKSGPKTHQLLKHPSRNAYGQIIIEPDENLSDKEVYPGQDLGAPAIDPNTDCIYSEEEYLDNKRMGKNIHVSQPLTTKMHGAPRTHAERGRPPPLQVSQQTPIRMTIYDQPDERDMEMMDSRIHGDLHPTGYDRCGMGPHDSFHHSGYGGGNRRTMQQQQNDSQHVGYGGGNDHRRGQSNDRHHLGRSQSPDKTGRWCTALFDFDPATMSPNPNACVEEIPFMQGDQIKIYGEKDPDGFYWGECRGRRGFVPHNMITDASNANTLIDHGKRRGRPDICQGLLKQMVALYDYDPKQASPNTDVDVEINFSRGQVVTVYGEPDDDGFYVGEVDGVKGLVPSNYLEEINEFAEHTMQGLYKGGMTSNRNVQRSGSTQIIDRGHGPGVRGPPLPPRDEVPPTSDRDLRKDACPQQYENPQDEMINRKLQNERIQTGRDFQNMMSANDRNIQRTDPNRTSFCALPTKTMPTNSTMTSSVSSQLPQQTINKSSAIGSGLKFPESPNIMQKISEITGGTTENSVDNILSKGKELIFMKFGLGK